LHSIESLTDTGDEERCRGNSAGGGWGNRLTVIYLEMVIEPVCSEENVAVNRRLK